MSKMSERQNLISIENQQLLDSKFFIEGCGASMRVLAVACELALEANFDDLVSLYERAPDIAHNLCEAARTALRGLDKLATYEASPSRMLH